MIAVRKPPRQALEGITEYKARTAARDKPRPKVCEVKDPVIPSTTVHGEHLTGSALRHRLIAYGIIVPLSARRTVLAQDDIGRVEAANGIFYNEEFRTVADIKAGGKPQGVLPDPLVVATIEALASDDVACRARENMFAPGGGKVRYERWPHPAPEEPDEGAARINRLDGRVDFPVLCGNRPTPERDALEIVMSAREVRAVPGMDEQGRWQDGPRGYLRGDGPRAR